MFLEHARGEELVAGVVGWIDLTQPDLDEALGALAGDPASGGHPPPGPGGGRPGSVAAVTGGPARPLGPGRTGAALRPDVPAGALPGGRRDRPGPSVAAVRPGPPRQGADRVGAAGALGVRPARAGRGAERLRASSPGSTRSPHPTAAYADLAPFVEVALEAFTPARVVFGSDWPVSPAARFVRGRGGDGDHGVRGPVRPPSGPPSWAGTLGPCTGSTSSSRSGRPCGPGSAPRSTPCSAPCAHA